MPTNLTTATDTDLIDSWMKRRPILPVRPPTFGVPGYWASALGLRHLTAQLLINRGIVEEQEARRYLDLRLADLRPPEGALPMAGFGLSGRAPQATVLDREVIGIFGDYDVDGVTTCALFPTF